MLIVDVKLQPTNPVASFLHGVF